MRRREDEPLPAKDGAPCCEAPSRNGYWCSLPTDHEWPQHIAYISDDYVCARWAVKEPAE